ncbi:acetylpolyamine aminohydrolase [candidate division MSBL1 archaeon SCGC-AAA382A20]|uniref:Acetylpolyamine aminohydrolase n=1 Tax=candidate division MSBL1 archaeon SCGC-AAA382A20 TaxID=1698280 RepID=A0A133VKE0_9EURY|nr:acetylpolyamine aminohydrolase [candidate division MSBL1 archaeon SCGC-AAA382A20]
MKVIFHENFKNSSYASNPAASEGRIESILEELEKYPDFEFIEPEPAEISELKLAHSNSHIDKIKRRGKPLFEMACLAAGGAIKTAEIAYRGEPAFGLIRPPGHHASPNSAWGFCYFSNMAIAIKKLMEEGKIENAFILDFDLHTGDGNINVLGNLPEVKILNPESEKREDYLEEISKNFESSNKFDVVAVSAGFDEHVEDWGGKLTTSDYREIGAMIKSFSSDKGEGRRFALLEGGYNHKVLGKNVVSFLKGFE